MNTARAVIAALVMYSSPASSADGVASLGQAFPLYHNSPGGASPPTPIQNPYWDGLAPSRSAAALSALRDDDHFQARGAKEIKVFKSVAPSVVMVLTEDSLGSGTLISSDGRVITNWHVVRDYAEVGVVFKPKTEGTEVTEKDIILAEVLFTDPKVDLALLRVTPQSKAKPVQLAEAGEIQVGADVHAIGHPTGEGWTYTKGFISQVRNGYRWEGTDKTIHQADVIQTQTPINPGNSGGPLVSDSGRLIGINSFGAEAMQGLNYAVSVIEVKRFLAAAKAAGPTARKPAPCRETALGEERSQDGRGLVLFYDFDCNGKIEVVFFVPDDANEPYEVWGDKNGDEVIDTVIVDDGRDGKWDVSFYDTDFDGKYDLVGEHPDGDIKPCCFSEVKG